MNMNEQTLARHYLYSFFSYAFSDPLRQRFALALREQTQIAAAASARFLSAKIDAVGIAEYLHLPREEIAGQYQNLFGLTIGVKIPANETEYCPRDITYQSQQIADIAGFYKAFHFDANPFGDEIERPDHIALELGFMGFLAAKEILADSDEKMMICRNAQNSFFFEHLTWWIPEFARAIQHEEVSGFYPALADAVIHFISFERELLGLEEMKTNGEKNLSCREALPAECGECPFSADS